MGGTGASHLAGTAVECGMRCHVSLALLTMVVTSAASPAAAQRYTFQRSFPVTSQSTLDVTTERGKVEVQAAAIDSVEVVGTVTVRVGWDAPADAVALAQQVASRPPIGVAGTAITLTDPADKQERRAVTVSYVVRVPATLPVTVRSESGALRVSGVRAPVALSTQSSVIDAERLGHVRIVSGSGAVHVSETEGDVTVETRSSSIEADAIGGDVHARTGSGSVRAVLTGAGDVDIETASSAIDVRGARGALNVRSNSGSVTIDGDPSSAWAVNTGSSRIVVTVPQTASFSLSATSRSGGVEAAGLTTTSESTRRDVSGAIGTAGPQVRLGSGSGSIRLAIAKRS